MKAIFFDTADTLYHSPEFAQAQEEQPLILIADHFGISKDEARDRFHSAEQYLLRSQSSVTKTDVVVALGLSRTALQDQMATLEPKRWLTPDSDLRNHLRKLSESYRLGIITNVNRHFLERILDAIGIESAMFSDVVSADNTVRPKPDSEPFLLAASLADCDARDCVYIGDSVDKDMIPAKRVGMMTVLVSRSIVSHPCVDLAVVDLNDLANVIRRVEMIARTADGEPRE